MIVNFKSTLLSLIVTLDIVSKIMKMEELKFD